MNPTIGRFVHYTLSEQDAKAIAKDRSLTPPGWHSPPRWNPVAAGETYPAMVVRTWGGSAVNLQVFLDGVGSYWATSRTEGEGEGKWIWPPRS